MERFAAEMRKGAFMQEAAAILRISRAVVYQWLEQGRKDIRAKKDTVYARFSIETEAAAAGAVTEAVDHVRQDEDWKAKAWFAERRCARLWSRKEHVDARSCSTAMLMEMAEALLTLSPSHPARMLLRKGEEQLEGLALESGEGGIDE